VIFIFIFIFVFHEIYIVVSVDAFFFSLFLKKKINPILYTQDKFYSTNGLVINIILINFYNIFLKNRKI